MHKTPRDCKISLHYLLKTGMKIFITIGRELVQHILSDTSRLQLNIPVFSDEAADYISRVSQVSFPNGSEASKLVANLVGHLVPFGRGKGWEVREEVFHRLDDGGEPRQRHCEEVCV